MVVSYRDFALALALKIHIFALSELQGVVFALAPIFFMLCHQFLPLPLLSGLILLPHLLWCRFWPCPHFLLVLPSMVALALALSVAILCHDNIEGQGQGQTLLAKHGGNGGKGENEGKTINYLNARV